MGRGKFEHSVQPQMRRELVEEMTHYSVGLNREGEISVFFTPCFKPKSIIPAAYVRGLQLRVNVNQCFVCFHPVLSKDLSRKDQFKVLVDFQFSFFS